jgi:hypothetical protein
MIPASFATALKGCAETSDGAMNMKTMLMTAVLLSALAPSVAMADNDDCRVPMARWQPREAVQQMAKAHAWTVQTIKIDDGCYEIKGQDEKGRAIEVKVHPASLAVIRVEYERNGHDDDHDDGGRGELSDPGHSGDATPPPAAPQR